MPRITTPPPLTAHGPHITNEDGKRIMTAWATDGGAGEVANARRFAAAYCACDGPMNDPDAGIDIDALERAGNGGLSRVVKALELADSMLGKYANGEKPYQDDDEGEELFATIAAALVPFITDDPHARRQAFMAKYGATGGTMESRDRGARLARLVDAAGAILDAGDDADSTSTYLAFIDQCLPALREALASISDADTRTAAYVCELDAGNGESVAIYRTEGGALFGIDASFVEQCEPETVCDPIDGRPVKLTGD